MAKSTMLGTLRQGRLSKPLYRLGQVLQQLGFVPPLAEQERAEVARWLSPPAITLFQSMSDADQQHSLRVFHGLQARGCQNEELLRAALLHDVGKAEGRVPFWTRPAIVIGKRCMPRLLNYLAVVPEQQTPTLPRWRRSLSNAWWHAEIGAELARQAGLSEQAVLYIRTHHDPYGPAKELHEVDEVS